MEGSCLEVRKQGGGEGKEVAGAVEKGGKQAGWWRMDEEGGVVEKQVSLQKVLFLQEYSCNGL